MSQNAHRVISVCAPKMTFDPKMKIIMTKDPKIIRVQKNLCPHYLGGEGNHAKSHCLSFS